jgi:predicted GNAT superfamily acetyltransferase
MATPFDVPIMIRRASSVDDYRALQEAQRKSWGIRDDGYLVPIATLVGANLHGGVVLGAFLPDGEVVAMSFAFLGRIGGRLCLYSQLTGVVPGYQSRGLGYQIKIHQRAIALDEGIERIAWAFDPLQAGNAHFNLARLGATAGHYVENMYGLRTDALNAGVPTDRLIVEWETWAEPAAAADYAISELPRLIETGQGESEPVWISEALAQECRRVLLPIPPEIARLRLEQPGIAEAWRVSVGQAFQAAFAAGYRAVNFVKDGSSGEDRRFYVLERL